MKLSEAKPGTFLDIYGVRMMSCGNSKAVFALRNEPIKYGENPLDIDGDEITKEEFMEELNKADHKGDLDSEIIQLMLRDDISSFLERVTKNNHI